MKQVKSASSLPSPGLIMNIHTCSRESTACYILVSEYNHILFLTLLGTHSKDKGSAGRYASLLSLLLQISERQWMIGRRRRFLG